MVCEDTKKELLDKENVCAVGEGRRYKDGQPTGEKCVSVRVRKKKELHELNDEDVIPNTVEGEKTDVVEGGEIVAQPVQEPHEVTAEGINTKEKKRPFTMGKSIGHYDITAGTAGFMAYREGVKVIDGIDEEVPVPVPVIITNNHVGANENQAEIGDLVLQPGPYDGGRHRDEDGAGPLHSFVHIEADNNRVDKSVVDDEDRNANAYIPHIGVPRDTAEVEVGDKIAKYGRTTGYREGEVEMVNARVRVRFSSGVKEFEDQILTTSVSKPGDSGSAGVKLPIGEEPELFGLLFAGSDSVTVFNPIHHVLNEGTNLYLNPEEVYEDNG